MAFNIRIKASTHEEFNDKLRPVCDFLNTHFDEVNAMSLICPEEKGRWNFYSNNYKWKVDQTEWCAATVTIFDPKPHERANLLYLKLKYGF